MPAVMTEPKIKAKKVISALNRVEFLPNLVGPHLAKNVETSVLDLAERFSEHYEKKCCGLWDFYKCSNGAGFMAPVGTWRGRLKAIQNKQTLIRTRIDAAGFDMQIDCETFGIIVTLHTLRALTEMQKGEWERLRSTDRSLLSTAFRSLCEFSDQHTSAAFIQQAMKVGR